MAGGTGSPYRAPCGGWPAGGARRFFRTCAGSHYVRADAAIPQWLNTTRVPNYDSTDTGNPTIAPYMRPDNGNPSLDCDGTDEPPCGPWPLATRPSGCPVPMGSVVEEVLNNCFQKQTDTVSRAHCHKSGIKNVVAKKILHGIGGFLEPDETYEWQGFSGADSPQVDVGGGLLLPVYETHYDASCTCEGAYTLGYDRTAPENMPGAKFLRQRVQLSIISSATTPGSVSSSANIGWTTEAHIERNSGVIVKDLGVYTTEIARTVGGVPQVVTLNDMSDCPWVAYYFIGAGAAVRNGSWIGAFISATATGGRIFFNTANPDGVAENQYLPEPGGNAPSTYPVFIPSGWKADELAARLTQTLVSGTRTIIQTATASVTNTAITLNITHSETDTGVTRSGIVSLLIELDEPYTKEELYQEVKELIAVWNLDDDREYPWRGGICSTAPLVCRREIFTSDTAGAFASAADPAWPGDPHADYYDGAIIGAPLPAGYEGFFDFDFIVYDTIGPYPTLGYGQLNTGQDGIPRNATHWTDIRQGRTIFPGKFLNYDPEVRELWAGDWRETKENWPSINFFRPCGADRAVLTGGIPPWPSAWPICGRISVASATQNGANVDIVLAAAADNLATADLVDFTGVSGLGAGVAVTVTDPTHFAVPGTLSGAYVSGGYVKSNGAPSYEWHDDQSKGDYRMLEWKFNYRDVGEYNRLVISQAACGGACDWFTDILAAMTEPRPNQAAVGMPQEVYEFNISITCALEGFCRPNVIEMDDFPDDFAVDMTYGSRWQQQIVQAVPDPFWRYDDAFPDAVQPWVEAISALPSGAPALPSGTYLNCLSLSDIDASVTTGNVCAPPNEATDGCDSSAYRNPPA